MILYQFINYVSILTINLKLLNVNVNILNSSFYIVYNDNGTYKFIYNDFSWF